MRLRLRGFPGFGAAVIRVDPSTGFATGTFLIPDTTTRWQALSTTTGKVFLVGRARDGSGVIATFDAPAS